jgi:hypothetical protein
MQIVSFFEENTAVTTRASTDKSKLENTVPDARARSCARHAQGRAQDMREEMRKDYLNLHSVQHSSRTMKLVVLVILIVRVVLVVLLRSTE